MSAPQHEPAAQLTAPPRAECRVSMAAIRANVRALAGTLERGTSLWAVVKANAYGHDVERVAEEAVAAGVRRLCVATLSEARQLRRAGMRVPILVMGPLDASSVARAAELDLSVTVLSLDMVDAVRHVAGSGGGRPVRVHLKVDTGMGRWGVPLEDVSAALDMLLVPGVELVGVMTHCATADDPNSTFFDEQITRFRDVVARVRDRVPGVIAHAANSAATMRSRDAHFDAVRCGIAVYGLSPTQGNPLADGLAPAMSLTSYVGDIKHLAVGDSVGYGRTFIADAPCRVALVPTGYADGIRRLASGRGAALINGARAPYAGTVSMDHLTLLLPGDMTAHVGDVVTLLGSDGDERITAEDHAGWAETINYEITCGIAGEPRLQRRYDIDP